MDARTLVAADGALGALRMAAALAAPGHRPFSVLVAPPRQREAREVRVVRLEPTPALAPAQGALLALGRARGPRGVGVAFFPFPPSSALTPQSDMARSRPWTRTVRRLVVVLTGAWLLAAQGCIRSPLARPSMRPFDRYLQAPSDGGQLTVHFLGTTSLLFRDRDSTAILMDGFVSRPRMLRVGLGRLRPNCARIGFARDSLHIGSLAAVFVGHAHYDHAMDAPVWAQITGAELVGSLSVKMLGLGVELPDTQATVVSEGVPVRFGPFELTFIESAHAPPDRYPGTIHAPLRPAKKTKAWKTGLVYSVFIQHRGRTILVQSTAGFRPGALRARRADVVYLAVGGLGRQPLATIDAYWDEVVRATGARRVILVHWDDFFRPLPRPLLATRYGGDDVARGIGRAPSRARTGSPRNLDVHRLHCRGTRRCESCPSREFRPPHGVVGGRVLPRVR